MGVAKSCCENEEPLPEAQQVVQQSFEYRQKAPDAAVAAPKPPLEPVPLAASTSSFSKEDKLRTMRHLEVRKDLVRGIHLQNSLRKCGRLWTQSPIDLPEDVRGQLYDLSAPVPHFDVFLSHTWITAGTYKVISLLFQSGWSWFLVGWLAGILVGCLLHATEALPPVLTYQCWFGETCLYQPYLFYTALAGSFAGLLASPYLPRLLKREVCFLDVVSINQVDPEIMEQGIYGLGGFLAVSSELRILYSGPYLTRLWCVFELAAYRTANPNGKVVINPVFVESGVLYFLAVFYLAYSLDWVLNAVDSTYWLADVFLGIFSIPGIHLGRKILNEKNQLISTLRNFDLGEVACRSDFDRDFIYAGIESWYGSKDAFTTYVRGPLADELVEPFSRLRLPRQYWLLLATPHVSSDLSYVFTSLLAGATFSQLLYELMNSATSVVIELLLTKLAIFVCDRFAGPLPGCLDYGKTGAIWIAYSAFVVAVLFSKDVIGSQLPHGSGHYGMFLAAVIAASAAFCDLTWIVRRCRAGTEPEP